MFRRFPFSPRLHTVIVVTFDSIARIDVRGSSSSLELVNTWYEDRPQETELPQAASKALQLGPQRIGRLYVLTSELWSGIVSLEHQIVGAIEEEQVEQALALEMEYESGISAFESRIGKRLIEEDEVGKTWQVVQAETAILDALSGAIPDWGGRIFAVAKLGSDDSSLDGVHDETHEPMTEGLCVEVAQEWLRTYLNGSSDAPLIELKAATWTPKQQHAARLSLVVATLLLCLIHHVHVKRQIDHATCDLSMLVQQQKQLDGELQKLEVISRDIAKAKQQQAEKIERYTKQIATLRRLEFERQDRQRRPTSLLRALSNTASETHCIERIHIDATHAVVSGLAIDSTSLQTFTERLEQELAASAWLIQLGKLSLDETRLIRFEIKLTPRPTKQVAPAKKIVMNGVIDVSIT